MKTPSPAPAATFDDLSFFAQPIVAVDSSEPRPWLEMLARPDLRKHKAVSIEAFMASIYEAFVPFQVDLAMISRGLSLLMHSNLLRSHSDATISFNIHPSSVLSDQFNDQVLALCDENSFPANQLCLELVEYCGRHEFAPPAQDGLETLRAAGVKLALDDLGSFATHASIFASGCLDFVKLDRSILHIDCSDLRMRKLISGLRAFCHALDAELVVEGVETREHMAFISDIGVDWAQGYRISPPAALTTHHAQPHWLVSSADPLHTDKEQRMRAIEKNGTG